MAVQKLIFVKQGVIHYKGSSATLEFFSIPANPISSSSPICHKFNFKTKFNDFFKLNCNISELYVTLINDRINMFLPFVIRVWK